jgi:hypothetical protein
VSRFSGGQGQQRLQTSRHDGPLEVPLVKGILGPLLVEEGFRTYFEVHVRTAEEDPIGVLKNRDCRSARRGLAFEGRYQHPAVKEGTDWRLRH